MTASIDRLDFHNPVSVGDMVTVRACVNFVGKTSMEVGVRVESENILQGRRLHTASAYLTFVALDSHNRPTAIPPLVLETEDERRRHGAAQIRRANRLKLKAEIHSRLGQNA